MIMSALSGFTTDELVHELHSRIEANMDGYIAMKIWHSDDVKAELEEMGFEPSEENADKVIRHNTRTLDCLADCTDGDWDIISTAITYTKDLKKATGKEN